MSSSNASPSGSNSPRSSNAVRTAPTADLELKDVVRILQRRKSIIAVSLLVGLTIAIVAILAAQKRYSATATIEVNKENANGLNLVDLSGIASGLGGEDQMNMDLLTEQAVITNDNTALKVIEALKLDSVSPYAIPNRNDGKEDSLSRERGLPLSQAPLERDRILNMFRGRLRVALVKGTRLLTVTFTDTDPVRATVIANAVVDEYINEYTQERFQASSKASAWLTGQLADLKDKVQTTQTKVDEFQRESGLAGMTILPSETGRNGTSTTVNSSDNVPLERLIELNRDLTSAEVTRIAKEAIFRMADTQDPDVVLGIGSSSLASGVGSDSPVAPGSADMMLLQQLRAQELQLNLQISAASNKYGDKNPLMVQLADEKATLGAQIRAELERIRKRTKNDLELAKMAEDGIRDQIAQQEQIVDKTNAKADQLVLLQEEALSSREIYQDLYTKLQEASVTAGMRASNITLVDPARQPVRPSFPKTRETVAAGGAVGLICGLIMAFMWDYFDDSITIPEEVELITTMPVIGVIPDFAQKQSAAGRYGRSSKPTQDYDVESSSWLVRAPRSQVAEAYRSLRTALLMSSADKPPKVILVISGSPSEGKSTTCFNTAAAFALQGDRVLYLDADLRRSQGHKFFGCTNDAGLSTCLTRRTPFSDLVRPFPGIDSLFLLPAGPHPPNPSELLGSRRFAELLEGLGQEFDYIFIDSPPILLVTDAQLLSSHVDGYVMVLRSKKTTKRILQRCISVMRGSKASALGIVVNAMDARSATYSGYGYYGTGSGYYVDEKE